MFSIVVGRLEEVEGAGGEFMLNCTRGVVKF